jgi:exopolysaccharide production protein ExoY
MVSVSEFFGGYITKNHSEPQVNHQSTLLRDCETTRQSKKSSHASVDLDRLGRQDSSVAVRSTNPFFHIYAKPVGGGVKRAFDIVIASTTILLMMPILLMIALLILVTMGRPILFSQQRVGFNGRSFGCVKFRTMVTDANERLAAHLRSCPEALRAWDDKQKLRNDPRITWLGQILRKSSLDELPQLFNILRGDMSCIGPRPVISDELERYGPYADDYVKAKPGLTGMWQVNGRSATSYAYRIKCDRYYVRRWSLFLDLQILVRTVPAVLKFDETS